MHLHFLSCVAMYKCAALDVSYWVDKDWVGTKKSSNGKKDRENKKDVWKGKAPRRGKGNQKGRNCKFLGTTVPILRLNAHFIFHQYLTYPTVIAHSDARKLARLEIPEGGHWAKAKTCSFFHERCNYSHVASSNWTQPSFKLMLTL
jgi:hypothetical protein